MSHVGIDVLCESLPNFPKDLLEEWLLPYANSEGWPPAPSEFDEPLGRWRYLLKKQPLAYWKSIEWRSIDGLLNPSNLSPQWQGILVDMVMGAVKGQLNLYSMEIPNLKERFDNIVAFLSENGAFPRPPALLVDEGGFTVLDGNHRLAAYFYCLGCLKEAAPQEDLRQKVKLEQKYWVGVPGVAEV